MRLIFIILNRYVLDCTHCISVLFCVWCFSLPCLTTVTCYFIWRVLFLVFLSLQSTKTFHPSLSVFAGVILSLCLSAAFRKNGVDDFSWNLHIYRHIEIRNSHWRCRPSYSNSVSARPASVTPGGAWGPQRELSGINWNGVAIITMLQPVKHRWPYNARVRVSVSVRVIFSITWPRPDTVNYVWQVAAS